MKRRYVLASYLQSNEKFTLKVSLVLYMETTYYFILGILAGNMENDAAVKIEAEK